MINDLNFYIDSTVYVLMLIIIIAFIIMLISLIKLIIAINREIKTKKMNSYFKNFTTKELLNMKYAIMENPNKFAGYFLTDIVNELKSRGL